MLAEYTSMAILLPASTLVGYGIGYGLDRLFGVSFLRVVFLVLGTAAGFVQIIRQLLQDARDDESS